MTENMATEVAAILENFREQERAAAIFESRRQKVVFTRYIGKGQQLTNQSVLEAVIDQNSTSDEIYQMVAKFDEAMDRHKAKIDLAEHYERLDAKIRELTMLQKASAEREINFRAEAAAASMNRRTEVQLTSAQEANLKNDALGMIKCRQELADIWDLVAIAKAIMRDGNPFGHLEDSLKAREAATR